MVIQSFFSILNDHLMFFVTLDDHPPLPPTPSLKGVEGVGALVALGKVEG